MCSICKDTLPDFEMEHTELMCPLRNSRYCSNCAQYGHLTKKCAAKPSILFREPAYLEQLIAPSELKELGITTKTPIKYKASEDTPPELIEIKNDDKVFAAYLTARAFKIPKGYTKKRALEEYAKLNNKRVVYIV
jgi:hypothetical protein